MAEEFTALKVGHGDYGPLSPAPAPRAPRRPPHHTAAGAMNSQYTLVFRAVRSSQRRHDIHYQFDVCVSVIADLASQLCSVGQLFSFDVRIFVM